MTYQKSDRLLDDEESNVREGAVVALGKITQRHLGKNPEKWQKWWQKNKKVHTTENKTNNGTNGNPTAKVSRGGYFYFINQKGSIRDRCSAMNPVPGGAGVQ
jgi:hypothetical protein